MLRFFGYASLLISVAIIGYLAVRSYQKESPAQESASQTGAIAAAKALYLQKNSEGMDFSTGPCLSDEVISGWAVDIAHNPRESIDEISQNQCVSVREGKVKHFVELDPSGNLISAQ